MKTLIIGSTGNIGTQIVKQLAAENQPIIAAARGLQKVKSHFDLPNIGYRTFDFTDQNTWGNALQGVGKIFLVVPLGSDAIGFEGFARDYAEGWKKQGSTNH